MAFEVEDLGFDDVPNEPDAVPFEAEGLLGDGDPTHPTGGIKLEEVKSQPGKPERVRFVVPVRYPLSSPDRKVFPGSFFLNKEWLTPGYKNTAEYAMLDQGKKDQYRIAMARIKTLFEICGLKAIALNESGFAQLVDQPVGFSTKQQFNNKARLEIAGFKKATAVAADDEEAA